MVGVGGGGGGGGGWGVKSKQFGIYYQKQRF